VQRSYETKEGEKRTAFELQIDEIGPSLRYATAQVTRTHSGSSAISPDAPADVAAPASDTPPDEPPF
jgi:single-strand DNA-binding protein